MLVLARKTSETVVIGEGITLEILQIKGGQVRMGITAPADVKILRGELKHPAIQPENEFEEESTCREPSSSHSYPGNHLRRKHANDQKCGNGNPSSRYRSNQVQNRAVRKVHIAGSGFPDNSRVVEVKIANVG